jgi:hypothetical protein
MTCSNKILSIINYWYVFKQPNILGCLQVKVSIFGLHSVIFLAPLWITMCLLSNVFSIL